MFGIQDLLKVEILFVFNDESSKTTANTLAPTFCHLLNGHVYGCRAQLARGRLMTEARALTVAPLHHLSIWHKLGALTRGGGHKLLYTPLSGEVIIPHAKTLRCISGVGHIQLGRLPYMTRHTTINRSYGSHHICRLVTNLL